MPIILHFDKVVKRFYPIFEKNFKKIKKNFSRVKKSYIIIKIKTAQARPSLFYSLFFNSLIFFLCFSVFCGRCAVMFFKKFDKVGEGIEADGVTAFFHGEVGKGKPRGCVVNTFSIDVIGGGCGEGIFEFFTKMSLGISQFVP